MAKMDEDGMLDNRGIYTGSLTHSMNPAFLIEKIIRERIFESPYWKEQCFALTASTILDRAVELTYIGGQYANLRPSEFLCLAFKLLQLQPEREIVMEYISDEGGGEFKYLRALTAFYIRLTFPPVQVYKILEPLLADYRKLKRRGQNGWSLTFMDEFVDDLLTKERVCDIALPRLPKRELLEDADELEPRQSALESEIESGAEDVPSSSEEED